MVTLPEIWAIKKEMHLKIIVWPVQGKKIHVRLILM
jgi:hypothetical protein